MAGVPAWNFCYFFDFYSPEIDGSFAVANLSTIIQIMTVNTILILGGYLVLILVTVIIILWRRISGKLKRSPDREPLTEGYGPWPSDDECGRTLEEESSDEYDIVMERLTSLLETERIYLNPDLRGSDVADRLGISESLLRTIIKTKTKTGDTLGPLLHKYRIREACRLVSLDSDIQLPDLMARSGYKSPTTFNNAFVRITGKTPAAWCKEYKQRKSKNEQETQASGKKSKA